MGANKWSGHSSATDPEADAESELSEWPMEDVGEGQVQGDDPWMYVPRSAAFMYALQLHCFFTLLFVYRRIYIRARTRGKSVMIHTPKD